MLVAIGFVTLAISLSSRVMFALAMPFIGADTGWDPVFLSAIMSVTLVVTGLLAPLAGRMIDQSGPRTVLLLGLGLISAGMALVAAVPNPVVMTIGFGLVGGGGFAMVSTNVVSTAVALAFTENRGLATGIATSGSSAGQFLFIPLFAILLAATSWRISFAAAALASLVLFGIVALALKPGRRKVTGEGTARPASFVTDLRYLISRPVFYLLFLSYFICGMTSTGIVESQFMPYAAFCGFPPLPTATAYGLLSLLNLGGMVLSGWLTDRVNRVALLASIYFIRGLSFLLLLNVGPSYETLIVFAVIFGLVDYSTVPVTVSLCASHLGTRVLGFAVGLISGGHALGAALGAMLGGVIFAQTGTYGAMWLMGAWTALAASALVLTIYRTTPSAAAAA